MGKNSTSGRVREAALRALKNCIHYQNGREYEEKDVTTLVAFAEAVAPLLLSAVATVDDKPVSAVPSKPSRDVSNTRAAAPDLKGSAR